MGEERGTLDSMTSLKLILGTYPTDHSLQHLSVEVTNLQRSVETADNNSQDDLHSVADVERFVMRHLVKRLNYTEAHWKAIEASAQVLLDRMDEMPPRGGGCIML